MSNTSHSSSARAIQAALKLFALHGFQRTSMADIAETAGLSRATLYLHFKDKEELFRALAHHVVDTSLLQMREAWRDGNTFGSNLEAIVLAKDGHLHRLRHTSPHGGELLTVDRDSILACAQVLQAGFLDFLEVKASLEEERGRTFEVFGGVPAFCFFVAQTVHGLKETVASEKTYRDSIQTFAVLVETATNGSHDRGGG